MGGRISALIVTGTAAALAAALLAPASAQALCLGDSLPNGAGKTAIVCELPSDASGASGASVIEGAAEPPGTSPGTSPGASTASSPADSPASPPMRLVEGRATALTPPAQSSEPPVSLGLATPNGPEEPASSDDLFTLVPSLGGIVARFKPFFSKDPQGSEGRSYGASLSGEIPYGFAGLPDSLSFTAHRETKPGQTHQRTWLGSGWAGEGGQVELDIGLHQTEKEESLTLGAAWRVSPLPAGRLSLEADADLANQPYGSLLLEGRLSF